MKKLVLLTSMVCAVFISQAQTTPTPPVVDINKVLEFKNADYNMGQIQTGKAVEYVVEAKNISKDTIILVTARAGCGCTTPNFVPNQKIAPGGVGKVTIGFNGGAQGPFTKVADIFFDNGLTKHLTFTGEGVPAIAPAATPATAATPGKN